MDAISNKEECQGKGNKIVENEKFVWSKGDKCEENKNK